MPQLEKFAAYLKLDCGLGPKTVEAYVSDARQFLEALTPASALKANPQQIQAYLESLSNHGIGQRSLARKLSALRMFFKLATAQGWAHSDPTEQVHAAVPTRKLPKTLAPEQIEALLAEPYKKEAVTDAVMLRVLYAAGLRVSELVSLTADQLDLAGGILRIQGKGEKVRIVPIDLETVAQITYYAAHIRPRLVEKARVQAKAQAFFLSSQGHGFTRQGFWKLLKKYAVMAGITQDVSPHVLRHAFATHLFERGMNLRSLQMLLGHSDISTTEIYSHVSKAHLHEALRRHHPKSDKEN